MKKLFSTIGVNGFNEAAEFLGMEISNNKEYKEFISFLFKTILDFCKEKSTPSFLFNLEVVPRRSGHIKPLVIDLKLLSIGQQGASKEKSCAA